MLGSTCRRFVLTMAIPLAILVGLLSIGAPADGWGESSASSVTTQATHTDHALVAPRRARFKEDLLLVVSMLWSSASVALGLLVALVLAALASARRRATFVFLPLRLRPGETPAALRAPPLTFTA